MSILPICPLPTLLLSSPPPSAFPIYFGLANSTRMLSPALAHAALGIQLLWVRRIEAVTPYHFFRVRDSNGRSGNRNCDLSRWCRAEEQTPISSMREPSNRYCPPRSRWSRTSTNDCFVFKPRSIGSSFCNALLLQPSGLLTVC